MYFIEPAHGLAGCFGIHRDTVFGRAIPDDIIRGRRAAESYANLLNKGLAHIERWRTLGTRVVLDYELPAPSEQPDLSPALFAPEVPDPLHL